jgi:hypothetical protein
MTPKSVIQSPKIVIFFLNYVMIIPKKVIHNPNFDIINPKIAIKSRVTP